MVFSSILFLFGFLPLLLIYYIVPFKFKNLVIMCLSLVFYSWGEPRYFFIMIVTILVNYILAIIIDVNIHNNISKILLLLSILFNLGELFYFKYCNFFIDNINFLFGCKFNFIKLTLPLGISFYIFQLLSYMIDVYSKKIKAERNIIDFATFVVLFPQLIAGPIVKYIDINRQLKYRKVNFLEVQNGIKLFIFGLGKKVLIANNIGMLWSDIETIGFNNISSILAWFSILAFALQIYFDFSGYSLMAIGLGKMLGFDFPRNFNYPYLSKSVTEFWRRWHITLSCWFKEYLYIPLGGSRCSKLRMYFNLFIVWFATGFWHGANWNFIFWGLFFFIFLVIEKLGFFKFLKQHNVISHIYLLFVILLSWSLFAITDIGELKVFFIKLFSFDMKLDWVYYLRNYFIIFVIAIILSTPFLSNIYNKVIVKNIFIETFILMIMLVLSVAYLVDATYNPFLYFRF